jgi:mono/diheme cytochrome c family protein
MNSDQKNLLSNDTEPTMRSGAVYLPMWLVGLLGFLLYWGCNYVDAKGGNHSPIVYEPYLTTNQLASFIPEDEFGRLMKIGQLQYGNLCAGCHQPHGGGAPGQAPPLAGSEWVTGGPNRVIRIPQVGVTGPIKVSGTEWNMTTMIGFGASLTDEQLAGVVTYIRNSWGNRAGMVSPEQVAKVRADLKGRAEQYTADDLLKVPDQIP